MVARGGLADPLQYGKTFTRVQDPIVWREVSDDLLTEAGVPTIYHAVATRVLSEGEQIEGVEVWTKDGPPDIRAKVTLDASGDADLVAMAGLPNFIGDNGRVQNPTMIFRRMGVDVAAVRAACGSDTIMPPEVSEMIIAANTAGDYALPFARIWLFPTTRPGELLCNCTRIIGADGRAGPQPRLARLAASVRIIEQPIDQSDIDAFATALRLGHRGVSSKFCEGGYRSLLNQARVEMWNEKTGQDRYFMSAEDLSTQPGLALGQDLALASLIGCTDIERNGHQYGDAATGRHLATRTDIFASHKGLYRWVRNRFLLRLEQRQLALDTVTGRDYGGGIAIDTARAGSRIIPLGMCLDFVALFMNDRQGPGAGVPVGSVS